jgi:hypothetical protein
MPGWHSPLNQNNTHHLISESEKKAAEKFIDTKGDKLLGDLDMNSMKIINLPMPTTDKEPATKAYVDQHCSYFYITYVDLRGKKAAQVEIKFAYPPHPKDCRFEVDLDKDELSDAFNKNYKDTNIFYTLGPAMIRLSSGRILIGRPGVRLTVTFNNLDTIQDNAKANVPLKFIIHLLKPLKESVETAVSKYDTNVQIIRVDMSRSALRNGLPAANADYEDVAQDTEDPVEAERRYRL